MTINKYMFSAAAAALVALSTACTTAPEAAPPPEQYDRQALPSTFLERLSADGLFAFGRASIEDFSPEGRAALDDLAARLAGRNVEIVHVIGHSDRIGTALANQRISSQRANSVRDYLVERGVPDERITAVGRGSVEPVVECEGNRGQAVIDCLAPNRRVEVRVQFAD